MSVDYKTQREVDRELVREQVAGNVRDIVEGYYNDEENISYILDLLEKEECI